MLLVVGEIVRPHGLRGEVVVNVLTDEPAQRYAPGSVLITDPGAVRRRPHAEPRSNERTDVAKRDADAARPVGDRAQPEEQRWRTPSTLTVEQARPFQGRMIVEFGGILDRDVAEELRGVLLCVDSATLPPSGDQDEFSDHELIGLAAVGANGREFGEVVGIDHGPAADLLVLRKRDGRTALVPFVKAIVPEVDLAGGRVVLTPPEGLLDL